ncbi:TylF/MycF/NovP-related O-methyltransferase [Candidatus Ponderosibacter sp. Uisw_141_02]|uniref:TylF/MycF/NovP-related O-methyltransferase n=1 Tax=Candidatus Ponderosibacter sp. Uisw_141_02 TaxID=3231000 RepID=UPI003D4BE1C6
MKIKTKKLKQKVLSSLRGRLNRYMQKAEWFSRRSLGDFFQTPEKIAILAKSYGTHISKKSPHYLPWVGDKTFILDLEEAYNLGFPKDKDKFEPSYWSRKILEEEIQKDIVRRYMVYQTSCHCIKLGGNFVEFGVHRGVAAALMVNQIRRWNQISKSARVEYFGFDSFEGVSEPNPKDTTLFGYKRWKKHSLKLSWDNFEYLNRALNQLVCDKHKIHLIKGWIPQTFEEVDVGQVSFALIDVDLYEPTKQSLEWIYPKLLKTGILLFDDYGDPECIGAKEAIDEFSKKNAPLIHLPDGLAMMIKS